MLTPIATGRLPVGVMKSTSYPASSNASSGPTSSSPQYPHSESTTRILLLTLHQLPSDGLTRTAAAVCPVRRPYRAESKEEGAAVPPPSGRRLAPHACA